MTDEQTRQWVRRISTYSLVIGFYAALQYYLVRHHVELALATISLTLWLALILGYNERYGEFPLWSEGH